MAPTATLKHQKLFSENLDLTLSYYYSHSSTFIQAYTHTSGLKYETLFWKSLDISYRDLSQNLDIILSYWELKCHILKICLLLGTKIE